MKNLFQSKVNTFSYRVVAQIQDDTITTTVTLFNKEVKQLIQVPIHKLIVELGEVSILDIVLDGNDIHLSPICIFSN